MIERLIDGVTIRTITLTRKLFTMFLSVMLYNHQLNFGQWLGATIVFAGISVEAFVKRKGLRHIHLLEYKPPLIFLSSDIHAKRVMQEKEIAKIKSL
jgi:solute carrier family 35 (UDP-galactose transporter), member B1